MFVPEIDVCAAALIVCPEPIEPPERLPGIRGGDSAFVGAAWAGAAIAAVMEYDNRIAQKLAVCPEEYAPVLQIDTVTGDPVREIRIDGFEQAMQLRPDAWKEFVPSGDGEPRLRSARPWRWATSATAGQP